MKNPEEAIERVLSGLREVEVPQGMERRVIEAVQARALERRGWSVAGLLGARPWTVAVAGVVMVALVAAVALHRKSPARHEVAGLIPHPSLIAPDRAPDRAPDAPVTSPQSLGPSGESAVMARRRDTGVAMPEPLSAEDALALSEMLAPSKPAPPLPLTHQERLLAEAVHQAAPEELSSLRPEVRAREMELSKAEFHDFFEPPPVKDNE